MGRLLDAIMDLVFLLGVVWTISRTLRGLMGGGRKGVNTRPEGGQKQAPSSTRGRMVRDPVCGMFVSIEVSHRLAQGREVLHFCSQECLEAYEKKTARV